MAQTVQTDNPPLIIRQTLDASPTLYRCDIDEHYHSVNGAIIESEHVYVNSALNYHQSNTVTVCEIGFGTGLNALTSAILSNKAIEYHTFEKFPIPYNIIEQLHYDHAIMLMHPLLDASEVSEIWQMLHSSAWNTKVQITPKFSLHKHHCDITACNPFNDCDNFDVVYFDAFAPDKQPEMWESHIFESLYSSMNENAILSTYCAKGAIRRMLANIGFDCQRIPGPPGGKREIIRAIRCR